MSRGFVTLSEPRQQKFRRKRAPIALAAMIGFVVLGALNVAPTLTLTLPQSLVLHEGDTFSASGRVTDPGTARRTTVAGMPRRPLHLTASTANPQATTNPANVRRAFAFFSSASS